MVFNMGVKASINGPSPGYLIDTQVDIGSVKEMPGKQNRRAAQCSI